MENARTGHTSACDPYSSRQLSPLRDTRSTNSGQVNEASDHALDCSVYHALEGNVRMQIQGRPMILIQRVQRWDGLVRVTTVSVKIIYWILQHNKNGERTSVNQCR